jgi:hypothetical protein
VALNYDGEGRLWLWQASPNNWSTYDGFLYAGAGHRVGQQAVSGGASTCTVYMGNLEAVSTTGSTTTTNDYGGRKLPAESVDGTVTYRAATGLARSSDRTLAIWRRKLIQRWSRSILWSR